MERPPEETWEWVRELLGDCQLVSQFAHDHGYSKLWRLQYGKEFAWLKMHTYPLKFAGEVHALTKWTPFIGLAPKVLGYQTDPNAVILSERPGEYADSGTLTSGEEERMWSEAGAWLRKLHANSNNWLGNISIDGTPSDTSSTDPEGYIEAIFEQRLRHGAEKSLLDVSQIEFTRERMKEWLPSLRNATIHAIHRDYTPRNWLVGPDGELSAVIDFEHARWDVAAADMNRWWDWDFLRNPRLIDAFYDAYGQPDATLAAQIQLLRLLNSVGGIVWSVKVKDHAFEQRNREALARMMVE